MKVIWKYPFKVADALVVRMPKGARILSVQMQGVLPCLWALVDEDAKREGRLFRVFGTGNPFDAEDGAYIGTFQERGLVWHLFEVTQ